MRNEAVFFLKAEVRSSASDAELMARLRELQKTYNDLTVVAPHVVEEKQYEAAKRSIEAGEASYRSDPLWKEFEGDA
jgi:hypothetical protein